MNYDVIIATRNRPQALKLSIPLILKQDHKPNKLIIVDSSDDHDKIRQTVVEAVGDCGVPVSILQSKPNLPLQRNIGLEHVVSPVVMFPDDDSLWYPGVAEAIMTIYELDTNGDIGGVCGAATITPPAGADLVADGGYKMSLYDRICQKVQRHYNKFISVVCPDPFCIHGRSRWNVHPVPEWLSDENAVLVEHMGGYRMSFRTKVIRDRGFDEDLGACIGYAKSEDTEASFCVMQKNLVVGARNAKVCHYKFPSRRAEGFKLGFISLLNPAYIVCRYSPKGSKARRILKRFCKYKLMQYMIDITTQFGRDRVRGTLAALDSMDELLNCPLDCLRDKYLEICERIIQQNRYNK